MSSDRDDICQLIYTYAELVDLGDFDEVGDLLGDATMTYEGYDGVEITGAVTIAELYRSTTRRYDDGTPKTKHVMTNVIVEVDGDEATSRSYFTVLQAVPGQLALQPVVAGRYRDRFVRIDGAWRFQAMHIAIDLEGDTSAHLLREV